MEVQESDLVTQSPPASQDHIRKSMTCPARSRPGHEYEDHICVFRVFMCLFTRLDQRRRRGSNHTVNTLRGYGLT